MYLNLSQYEYMTSNLYILYMQSHVSLQGFTNIYKNQARKYISYVNLYFWMHSRYHACTVPFYTYGREFRLPDSIYVYMIISLGSNDLDIFLLLQVEKQRMVH